ncbi:hypothetical protein AOLI_G00047070 [Acnodon oligacanthus]
MRSGLRVSLALALAGSAGRAGLGPGEGFGSLAGLTDTSEVNIRGQLGLQTYPAQRPTGGVQSGQQRPGTLSATAVKCKIQITRSELVCVRLLSPSNFPDTFPGSQGVKGRRGVRREKQQYGRVRCGVEKKGTQAPLTTLKRTRATRLPPVSGHSLCSKLPRLFLDSRISSRSGSVESHRLRGLTELHDRKNQAQSLTTTGLAGSDTSSEIQIACDHSRRSVILGLFPVADVWRAAVLWQLSSYTVCFIQHRLP